MSVAVSEVREVAWIDGCIWGRRGWRCDDGKGCGSGRARVEPRLDDFCIAVRVFVPCQQPERNYQLFQVVEGPETGEQRVCDGCLVREDWTAVVAAYLDLFDGAGVV